MLNHSIKANPCSISTEEQKYNNSLLVVLKVRVWDGLELRWPNTVSPAVSGVKHDGAGFKTCKQTWRRDFFIRVPVK